MAIGLPISMWNRSAPAPRASTVDTKPRHARPSSPVRLVAPRRATQAAAIGLWAFALFTGVALVAWFRTVPLPWTVGSIVAISTAAAAAMMSFVIWRSPTRGAVIAGAIVIAASLLRLGLPSSWTVMSAVVFDLTVMAAIPVVRAILVFSEPASRSETSS
jgi:hypothetical protein